MLCQEELAKSKPLTLCGTGGERTTSPEKGPAIPRAGRGQPPEGTRRLSPLLVLFAQGGGGSGGPGRLQDDPRVVAESAHRQHLGGRFWMRKQVAGATAPSRPPARHRWRSSPSPLTPGVHLCKVLGEVTGAQHFSSLSTGNRTDTCPQASPWFTGKQSPACSEGNSTWLNQVFPRLLLY